MCISKYLHCHIQPQRLGKGIIMDYKNAIEWLKGNRSMTNIIPQDPFETWQVRIAEADAAMTQQAYWIVKAEAEKLVKPAKHPK